MPCENHEEIIRRLSEHDTRLDSIEITMQKVQIGCAAKDEQIKTIFIILAEIKQMLKDYTVEMKLAITALAKDVETMKGRPGRFFDGAVTAAIAAIVGAVVMYAIKL